MSFCVSFAVLNWVGNDIFSFLYFSPFDAERSRDLAQCDRRWGIQRFFDANK